MNCEVRKILLAFLATPCPSAPKHDLALRVLDFYCVHCGRVAPT